MKKSFDILIFLGIIGLSLFSLFTIFGIKNNLFLNQLTFFIIGFFILWVFYKIGFNFFQNNSHFFYFLGLFFLILSFFTGPEIRGSRRWIDFYFFKFQPSEIFKPFFIIYLADLFGEEVGNHSSSFNFKKILISFLFFFVPTAIVFKQPDLGNSLIYVIIYLGILFFTNFPLRNFIYLMLLGIIFTPIVWHVLAPYQQERILSFIKPESDPHGISYNLIQSVITIGSGGAFGQGLGLGKQSRLAFLPENHTDFAFASLIEQFGFIGGLMVIVLYGLIVFRLIKKTEKFSEERVKFLFLTGVILLLIFQIFINIGMNMGILPITGITLPLISYGGSSIISILMILGLTLSL